MSKDYVYRTANQDGGAFWTTDPQIARSYADNSGYGGGYLWRREEPLARHVKKLKGLADVRPYVDDTGKLDSVYGVNYVFDALENMPEVAGRLREEGYEWVEYPDPLAADPDAWTLGYIGKAPLGGSELVERVADTHHPRVPELDARLGIKPTKEVVAAKTPMDSFEQEKLDREKAVSSLREQARELDSDLKISLENPPQLWSLTDTSLSIRGVAAIKAYMADLSAQPVASGSAVIPPATAPRRQGALPANLMAEPTTGDPEEAWEEWDAMQRSIAYAGGEFQQEDASGYELDDAMLPTRGPLRVYRGVDEVVRDGEKIAAKDLQPGDIIEGGADRYTSVSLDRTVAKDGFGSAGKVLELDLPVGTPALALLELSPYGDQSELILPRGFDLHVERMSAGGGAVVTPVKKMKGKLTSPLEITDPAALRYQEEGRRARERAAKRLLAQLLSTNKVKRGGSGKKPKARQRPTPKLKTPPGGVPSIKIVGR